jgi:hypothetical protein
MSVQAGRTEKRVSLTVPVELFKLQNPASIDSAVTENVCSIGARVLTARAMKPDERVGVRFVEPNLRTRARVVYCQRLRDGHCRVGLQFQKMVGVSKGFLRGSGKLFSALGLA